MFKVNLFRKTGLAWAILGIGLLVTVLVSLQVKQSIEQAAVKQFAFSCDQVTLKIQEHLNAFEQVLRGGEALFATSDTVVRKDWQAYVEILQAARSISGMQGVGFAEAIPADRLAAHIARIRREGFPEYTVNPPGERANYTAIVYLEPFRDRNLRDFGFDMYSDPVRRAAMEQARDTNDAVLSGKVELVKENGTNVQAGVFMYVPVYRNGAPVDTVEQRRAALIGWVFGPFYMNDLMADILQDWESHEGKTVDLAIYDGREATPASLLFGSKSANPADSHSLFYQQRTINFKGRQWSMVFNDTSAPIGISYAQVWLTLVGGLAFSGLLFGLLRTMINTQANAVRIADKLTEESKRQAKLLMESEAFKLAILNSLAAETQAGAVRIADKLAEESKRHAKLLMESEAFKLTIMNSLAAEIAVVDHDGVIQAVNEPWRRSDLEHNIESGEPAPHTEVGANYLEVCQAGVGFTSDEDALHAHEGIQAVLDGSLPSYSMEYPSHSPTQQQWFMMTVLPMGEGASRSVVVTHTDITGRKQAEEELRSSEERLSIITSSAQDAIIMLDEGGNIAFWNQAAERIFGYAREEVIGHDLNTILVPLTFREAYRQAFQDFQKTGQGAAIGKTLELAGLRKDGSEFPLEVALSAVQVKGAWHLIGIVRDITERIEAQKALTLQLELVRQAEETLRIANEEQRAIFDSATSGIALIKNRVILHSNRKLEEIFGYDSGELIGQSTRLLYPDTEAYQISSKEIENGKFRFERQLIRKDGSLFWARLSGQALDNENPEKGTVGIIDDITLEHEATNALLKAKEMAEDATRIKSEFLTNMSHGIRTPMNGVLGMLDLLRETDMTPTQLDWVETAYGSGEVLREIINNILDLSKLEAGKVVVEQVNFNLVDLVDDICAAMAGRAHANRLELNCLLPQALSSHWRGDPLRIRQVLTNLIDNAVKFTEQGEVSVNVIQLSIADNQNELRFEVHDTGIGISPAAQLQLFKSFSQGDSATSRSLGGSGLGLFISKKLVELMGGTIGANSVQGVGSCFWFTLPLVQSEGMETTESFYDLAGKRTLIVDDNATNRNILGTYLSSWGLEVSVFDNGSTALMQLQTSALQGPTYDLIVLDMQMPNMDGLTLAKYLAEIPALAKIPIILLSSGDQLELADYESTGIVQRLLKPARQLQLFDAVVNALQGGAKVTPKPALAQLERPSYKGKKVLIVEDNKINQKVIVAKLAKFDIVPDLAENGQLALDTLAQSVYDLILMDCQMPVMDGYIATRELRLLEASQGLPHQTVIALTASAMKGDREKCLAAGMDDYLTKPIVTEQLMDMLACRLGAQPAEITPALSVEESTPVIVWDATAALENLDGDSALLDEMIALFLIEGPKQLSELSRVQAEGNLPALANAAHAIKGTVAQFYAESAKACALLLEQTARSGQSADYQGMTNALINAVTDLINNLRLAKSPK